MLLVDLNGKTNIAGTAAVTSGAVISPGGVPNPSITPVSWVEAVNMLDTAQLDKFNITLDLGGTNRGDQAYARREVGGHEPSPRKRSEPSKATTTSSLPTTTTS